MANDGVASSTRVYRMVHGLRQSPSAGDLDRFPEAPLVGPIRSRSRTQNNEISRRLLVAPRIRRSNYCNAEAKTLHPTAMRAIALRKRSENSQPNTKRIFLE